jgi:hypothetical protein
VRTEGGEVVVQDSQGKESRYPRSGARSVRVVPLTGGDHHSRAGAGWQVTLRRDDGDVLVGDPFADWRPARELADLVCARAGLALDELSARLFSRVGTYSPPTKD